MNAEDLFLQLWARIVHDEDEAVPGSLAWEKNRKAIHARLTRAWCDCVSLAKTITDGECLAAALDPSPPPRDSRVDSIKATLERWLERTMEAEANFACGCTEDSPGFRCQAEGEWHYAHPTKQELITALEELSAPTE